MVSRKNTQMKRFFSGRTRYEALYLFQELAEMVRRERFSMFLREKNKINKENVSIENFQ